VTHVSYPCTQHYHPDSFVQSAAQAFMQGYNDNHSTVSYVVVGTNNDEVDSVFGSGSISPDWQTEGATWGGIINGLEGTAPPEVIALSGNDIEGWSDPDGWVACGGGAEAWYNGYESQTTTIYNVDFGSEAFVEAGSSYWSQQQVFDVAFGRQTAAGMPEIYCDPNGTQWTALAEIYQNIIFTGVMSDNASSTICNGNSTMLWSQS
jgi:hypothetical protein